MKYEYSETFESLADRICGYCISSDGECECLDYKSCPYWSEFEDLHKLCVKVDRLANDILGSASKTSADEIERNLFLDRNMNRFAI